VDEGRALPRRPAPALIDSAVRGPNASIMADLLSLFDRRERWQLAGLFLLMLSAAAVETVGIGAVMPFMRVAIDPATTETPGWMSDLYRVVGKPQHIWFVVLLGGGLVLLYVAKNAYFYWATHVQQTFLIRKRVELVSALFGGYLRAPYPFHLENNSALLLRNINNVDLVFSGMLQPSFVLLTDALIVACVLAMLAVVEPMLTLAAIALVVPPALVLHRALKRHLVAIGYANQELVGRTSKTIIEGLNGIKEVIVTGRGEHFVWTLAADFRTLGGIRRDQLLAAQAPRLLLEPILTLGLVAIVLGLVASQAKGEDVLPIVALFGVASVRILAAAARMLPGLQQLQFSDAVRAVVVRQLLEFRQGGAAPEGLAGSAPGFPVRLRGVSFTYPGRAEAAIVGLDLEIPRGAIVGIVGRSGAGKSTLMDLMLGLLAPSSGSITANGIAIERFGPAWSRWIGYIPQAAYLLDDSLRRNVAFGVPDVAIDDAAVRRACTAAQLSDVVRDLPQGLETAIGERGVRLSGGQRQRIAIARALYHAPSFLLMDEATSALDRETEAAVSRALKELAGEKTLVIIAHRLRTVADCSEIVWLERGRIVDRGTYQELVERNPEFRRFADVELVPAAAGGSAT
jgi:ATP-binding cassette subfamily C protein